jgi:hypothetical protein
MTNVIMMIIAILVLLVIAEIPYFWPRSRSTAERPMTNQQDDHYRYTRNH